MINNNDVYVTHLLCDVIDADEPHADEILKASIRMIVSVRQTLPEIEHRPDELEQACLRIVEMNRGEWKE